MQQWLLDRRLMLMIFISLLLHFVVIAGVKFTPPDFSKFKDKLPSLDVILVNAQTFSRPEKADVLAQSNLNRGGNTDENRRMKSALPDPKSHPKESAEKPLAQSRELAAQAEAMRVQAEQRQQQVQALEQQVQQVMTQINAPQKMEQTSTTVATSPKINASDLVQQSLEAVRLEAEIAKEQEVYQKRPKRKHIGARAEEYRFAAYVESWRQKVEKIGNLNYPEAAKTQKLYGSLQLMAGIKADGSLEYIEITRSSGYKVLDNAAKRIVELGAPYAEFPADIRRDTDVIEIVRTWTFTHEDKLTGQ